LPILTNAQTLENAHFYSAETSALALAGEVFEKARVFGGLQKLRAAYFTGLFSFSTGRKTAKVELSGRFRIETDHDLPIL